MIRDSTATLAQYGEMDVRFDSLGCAAQNRGSAIQHLQRQGFGQVDQAADCTMIDHELILPSFKRKMHMCTTVMPCFCLLLPSE